jgi:hypothetical protein
MNRSDVIRHLRNACEIEIFDANGFVGKWVRWFDGLQGKDRWMQVVCRFYA